MSKPEGIEGNQMSNKPTPPFKDRYDRSRNEYTRSLNRTKLFVFASELEMAFLRGYEAGYTHALSDAERIVEVAAEKAK